VEIGGGWSHPLAQKWGGRTTPFWPRGGFGHPIRPVWGGRSHPQAFGGGPATPKATKKKKKKFRNGFVPLGVAGPPPRAWGGFGHPLRPHPGPWGWSGHPQRHKPILIFFFFLVAFGVAGPPPKAWGWLRPPHTGHMGWPKPPPISPFFFSFFLFLKKKNQNLAKTTLFWAKRRRFGRAQNGVVLE
jgi:hypothetical protein